MKRILVLGSGGREHALAWKLAQSSSVSEIFVAPGNGGTATMAKSQNLDSISVLDFEGLKNFVKKNNIYMTVVGPDDPLALGIVDFFQAEGLRIWGPSKAAAEIEASKAFAKQIMLKAAIPTASFKTFKSTDYKAALEYIQKQDLPLVVKASGLALGKGVTICRSLDEAVNAIEDIAVRKIFAQAGDEFIVEEFLDGPEISIHAFCDGDRALIFPPSQDHKAIFDGNTGPNTGGMGTIAPVDWVSAELMLEAETIVNQTLVAMKQSGREFQGLLYPGLKITKQGIRVLEYNARFGDPETQSYLRLLETDLFDILDASIDRKLGEIKLHWAKLSACNIVLASAGYPGTYDKSKLITGIAEAEQDPSVVVFHAGTKVSQEGLLTNGGRVLGVSATGIGLKAALDAAYRAVEKIHFEGKTFRRDIGAQVLSRLPA